tara:strand:- start:313 stop:603 length:291 start_codon:yes stop_codon:yes gene_type:complete
MKELQELRNEVLSLRNMGEITKQTESILLHKLNALKAAINYTHSCETLKDEEEMTFTKWLNKWNWEQIGNSYVFKRGESYTDAESLMKSYKKEYNL